MRFGDPARLLFLEWGVAVVLDVFGPDVEAGREDVAGAAISANEPNFGAGRVVRPAFRSCREIWTSVPSMRMALGKRTAWLRPC